MHAVIARVFSTFCAAVKGLFRAAQDKSISGQSGHCSLPVHSLDKTSACVCLSKSPKTAATALCGKTCPVPGLLTPGHLCLGTSRLGYPSRWMPGIAQPAGGRRHTPEAGLSPGKLTQYRRRPWRAGGPGQRAQRVGGFHGRLRHSQAPGDLDLVKGIRRAGSIRKASGASWEFCSRTRGRSPR